MTLLPSLPEYGLPGQIASTKPSYIETCRYLAVEQGQVYTLDLNPIAGSILPNNQYSLLINGSLATVTYQANGGSAVQSLASQIAGAISRYGYFWATIQSTGVIRLTNRTIGVSVPIVLSVGLIGATLTQTTPAVAGGDAIAGTLLFLVTDNNQPDGHRLAASYDYTAAALGGSFSALRDCGGIVLRPLSNYTTIDSVPGDYLGLVRQGLIWVRNYGSTAVNRLSPVRIYTGAANPEIPYGSFGAGLDLSTVGFTARDIAWDSYTLPGDIGRIRINLN